MTKMATVHAQQMWEYMAISHKTTDYLVTELNEFGKLGWELVGASYHKDVKTSLGEAFCWTAILKRPLVPQVPTAGTEATAAVTEPPDVGVTSPPGVDSSIFDVQAEENDLEGENDQTG